MCGAVSDNLGDDRARRLELRRYPVSDESQEIKTKMLDRLLGRQIREREWDDVAQ